MNFRLFTIHCLFFTALFCQSTYNPNPTKYLIAEYQKFSSDTLYKKSSLPYQLTYNQYFYYNTNQPNLENHNGYYFPKGFGSMSSLLMQYKGKHLFISVEPHILYFRKYSVSLPEKKTIFSVLNDVPLDKKYKIIANNYKNTGLIIHYSGLSLGYGNWDQWWGPGIHNSLVISNNAEGIPHYFIGTLDYQPLIGDLKYYFKYLVSDAMLNSAGIDYFLSVYYFNLRYKNIELGKSRHILNGGDSNLPWSLNDALGVIVTEKNMKYWDEIIDYYVSVNFPFELYSTTTK